MPLSSQAKLQLLMSLLEDQGSFPTGGGAEGTIDQGSARPGAPTDYTNLEEGVGRAFDVGSHLLDLTPAGLLGSGMRAGIKGANASLLDEELEAMGFERGLSFGQKLGAAFGLNSYGTGGKKARRAAQQMAAKDAMEGGRGYKSQSRGPRDRGALGRGRRGGGAAERSKSRSHYDNTNPGRRGARDRSGFGERSSDLGSDGRHGEL